MFNGAWYSDIPKENYVPFADHFYDIFGKTPYKVSALSYDIVSVISALASYVDTSEGEVFNLQQINNPSGFSGVSGVFRFNMDGIVERLFEVYEVENGRVKTIEPALYQFRKNVE